MSTAPAGAQGARLQKNVLSVWNCIALSVALMGPVLAVVLNAPAAGPSTGAAMPLAFLIALIVIIFVGNTVVQFRPDWHGPHRRGRRALHDGDGGGGCEWEAARVRAQSEGFDAPPLSRLRRICDGRRIRGGARLRGLVDQVWKDRRSRGVSSPGHAHGRDRGHAARATARRRSRHCAALHRL